jgi:sulfur carrier protein
MSLTLVLNGQSRSFTTLSQSSSLDALVAELGLQGDRVAVEHNGTIVPRASWPETVLGAGDRLEVVHFVGGGCGTVDVFSTCPQLFRSRYTKRKK